MSENISTNIILARKIKKLGSCQEVVLAGVAEQLTEDEKASITLALGKMDNISRSVRIQEEEPINQCTSGKPKFEPFFENFKNELRAYEDSDRMDSLMFSSQEYFNFKVDLYKNFEPFNYQRYIEAINSFEGQANRILLFLAADRGFIYSKMREDCLMNNMVWKEFLSGRQLSYTMVNNHILFHNLVVKYPRLLISNAAKTEWFTFMKKFEQAIEDDNRMKTRLALDLKEFVEEDSLFEDATENFDI